jgi:DNA invertase Pin-like site-specific DNA recombinase
MKTYDVIVRVSRMGDRPESADSTMTLEDQRARAREEVAAAGGQVGLEHMATDVSGFSAVESPDYRRAVERIRTGAAQGLAFAYGDRMVRNWWDAGRFFTELEKLGGEVLIAGRRGVDYRSPDGRASLGMDAIMSERQWWMYKERGERTADRVIFERGVANVVPYGYRRNGGRDGRGERVNPALDGKALVPDPHAAEVVRRIFDRRISGVSWTELADELNTAEIPAPRGGHWTVSTLRSIIRNESYLGVARYKDRRNEHAHEPLVSRSTWAAAQAATTVQRTGAYAAGVAGGLLRCSGCGRRLVVAGSKQHVSYGCRRQHNGGRCPAPVFIAKRPVDEFVDDAIRNALEGRIGTAPQLRLAELAEEEAAVSAELEAYVEVASALDRGMFERGLRVRREKLDAARAARAAEEAKVGLAEELPAPEEYAKASLDVRRRVAAALIAEVVVAPAGGRPVDRLDIRWR